MKMEKLNLEETSEVTLLIFLTDVKLDTYI